MSLANVISLLLPAQREGKFPMHASIKQEKVNFAVNKLTDKNFKLVAEEFDSTVFPSSEIKEKIAIAIVDRVAKERDREINNSYTACVNFLLTREKINYLAELVKVGDIVFRLCLVNKIEQLLGEDYEEKTCKDDALFYLNFASTHSEDRSLAFLWSHHENDLVMVALQKNEIDLARLFNHIRSTVPDNKVLITTEDLDYMLRAFYTLSNTNKLIYIAMLDEPRLNYLFAELPNQEYEKILPLLSDVIAKLLDESDLKNNLAKTVYNNLIRKNSHLSDASASVEGKHSSLISEYSMLPLYSEGDAKGVSLKDEKMHVTVPPIKNGDLVEPNKRQRLDYDDLFYDDLHYDPNEGVNREDKNWKSNSLLRQFLANKNPNKGIVVEFEPLDPEYD